MKFTLLSALAALALGGCETSQALRAATEAANAAALAATDAAVAAREAASASNAAAARTSENTAQTRENTEKLAELRATMIETSPRRVPGTYYLRLVNNSDEQASAACRSIGYGSGYVTGDSPQQSPSIASSWHVTCVP